MKRYNINSFIDKESGKKITEFIVFEKDNKCLIFNKYSGHIILLDSNYLKTFENEKIPKELFRRLESRGFVENHNEHFCNNACDVLPEFFMVDLTNKCNMHCKYCLRNVGSSNKSISKSMIVDICKYISKYCEREHLLNVSIQPWGGEPLLELESILLMKKLIKPVGTKVHFSVETNGILLTQKTIDKLYDNQIAIGISIDGCSKVHDSQRVFDCGKATHNIVEKNLLLAKEKYKDKLGTITTVTKNNSKYIEEILEYFACELKLKNVKFNFVHKSMFSDCEELCLSNDEISDAELRMLNKIVELNEKGYHISEHNIKVKIKNLLFREYSDICHSKGCCGGKKMIVFDMMGNIYPCELTDTPTENIGNIYDKSSLISTVNKASRNRDYFIPKKANVCETCEWYVFCQGGCTVRAISCGKRPPEIDMVECAVNKALYPALVELILTKPRIINLLLGFEAL